ncbi:MAG: hypothetical protein QXO71_05565 [Candidatus Jordarchaeaceae archaeon]
MNLCSEDVKLFYKLYQPLLIYFSRKFKITNGAKSPEELNLWEIIRLGDELFEHPKLINSFIKENPYKFSKDELSIVRGWKNFVKGELVVYRYLKKYTIFLDIREPPKAYGVLGLESPPKDILGPLIPRTAQTVLIPFKGKIIYGFLEPYNIFLRGGIRHSVDEIYQEAKDRFGIITSLPFSAKKRKAILKN